MFPQAHLAIKADSYKTQSIMFIAAERLQILNL